MNKPFPTHDLEEAAINAGIASDPDTEEFTAEEMRRAWHGNPMDILKHLDSLVIVDEDIAAHFAASHKDWRKAINDALRKLIDAA